MVSSLGGHEALGLLPAPPGGAQLVRPAESPHRHRHQPHLVEGGEEREEVEEAHHIEHYLESGVVGRAGDRVVDGRPVDVVAVLAPAGDTTNSAY